VYSTQAVWLIALLAAIAGVAGGYFLSLRLRRDDGGDREAALRQLQQEQEAYRQRVTQHFSQTAELLSQLASNYRDVHNHLAQGARELCDPATLTRLQPIDERAVVVEPPAAAIEPPRDYAPRPHADAPGTLDEDYGLDKPQRSPLPEPPRY
jgi:uncharacterized membrane-anchored protein YhcB (DUF1043 family)